VKREVSPALVAIAIAVVMAVIAFMIWKGTNPTGNSAEIEKTIQAGVAHSGPASAGPGTGTRTPPGVTQTGATPAGAPVMGSPTGSMPGASR
jgi:hypothetical protein